MLEAEQEAETGLEELQGPEPGTTRTVAEEEAEPLEETTVVEVLGELLHQTLAETVGHQAPHRSSGKKQEDERTHKHTTTLALWSNVGFLSD